MSEVKEREMLSNPEDPYRKCFTDAYWENEFGQKILPAWPLIFSRPNIGGRNILRTLQNQEGGRLRMGNSRPIKEKILRAAAFSSRTAVKVIAESLTIQFLPEEANEPLYQEIHPDHDGFAVHQFSEGRERRYMQKAYWFFVATGTGNRNRLFPVDVDYDKSHYAGPYGNSGNIVAVTNVQPSGIFELPLGRTEILKDGTLYRRAEAYAFDVQPINTAANSSFDRFV